MRSLALVISLIALPLFACASAADDDATADDQALATSAASLVGSWTVADAPSTAGARGLPFVEYRTVAGLILRADGTYFAQVAPREVTSTPDRYRVDDHTNGMRDGVERIGAWQGIDGRYVVEASGSAMLVHLQRSAGEGPPPPDLVLRASLEGDRLALTNDGYAGGQSGKTDTLRRVADDCRVKTLALTAEERATDAMAETILGAGRPANMPTDFELDTAGDVAPNAARCTKRIAESSLRFVWRDKSTHATRAVASWWSESGDPSREVAQTYFYDESGVLRLVTTTVQTQRIAPADLTTKFGPLETVEQSRTYFDARGVATRTLVQPHVEEALVEMKEDAPFVGRRFTTLQEPVAIIDLPVCAGSAPAMLAKDRTRASASLDAPPVCADALPQ